MEIIIIIISIVFVYILIQYITGDYTVETKTVVYNHIEYYTRFDDSVGRITHYVYYNKYKSGRIRFTLKVIKD